MFLAFVSYSFTILTTWFVFSNISLGATDSSHIILSIISYLLMFVSFIVSFILNYQQNHLRNHEINKYIDYLPALEQTEKFLFTNIYLSLLFLSTAIISGFIFLEDIFSQQLSHKVFFTIFAWFLLVAITIARLQFGLRDKKATRSIQVAFILIVIGYFGSKIVLDVLNT